VAKVAKLVVVPVTFGSSSAVGSLSGWIRATNTTNAELIPEGKRSRQWISKLLEQALRNQVVSVGSIFPAKIKGQQRFFRVNDVQFTQETNQIQANRGVMIKESTVEIVQEPPVCTNKRQATIGGMDDLVKEICHFICKNPGCLRPRVFGSKLRSQGYQELMLFKIFAQHNTAESFSRVDAYMRLGIPNKKAVVVSGVAGSGKKTVIT